MEYSIKIDPQRGRMLWLTDGVIELAASLEFGIRISHLSLCGMENLFFRQPEDDTSLNTPAGWKIRGGHRLWLTPETDLIYWPDNDPVDYEMLPDGVLLTQKAEDWMHVRKQLKVRLLGAGQVELTYILANVGETALETALWQVNTVDGGGRAEIPFGGYGKDPGSPERNLSLWGATNLGDSRVTFTKDSITAQHDAANHDYFKLGLYNSAGKAALVSKGQRLELSFGSYEPEKYPDKGYNFELYMNPNIMELETLGPVQTILPGESAAHKECWKLTKA